MSKFWPDFQRFVATGTTVGGDVWAFGVNTIWGAAPGLPMAYADQATVLASIKTAFDTWWTDSSGTTPRFLSLSSVTMLKYNSIGHDGKYKYPLTTEVEYTPPVPGAVSAGGNPRVSLVVSLRTDSATRGRGAFGRFYPPTMSNLVSESGTTPYIAESSAQAVANHAAAFLGAINAITVSGEAVTVANVSPGDSVVGTSALTYPVDYVEVDRVMDTQRRRTNRIPRLAVTQGV